MQLAEEGTEEKYFLFVYDLIFYQLDYSSLRVTKLMLAIIQL
jgi:hypothetical protein